MITSNSAHAFPSVRPGVPAHRGRILLMWLCYLLSPILTVYPLHNGISLFPAALLLSILSFGLAVWLILQRNVADMLNGGIKLTLDALVTIALVCTLIQNGTIATMLASLSR